MPQFSIMTNDDLIRHVETVRDSLSSTSLETELVSRLRQALDDSAETSVLLQMLSDRNITDNLDTAKLKADLDLLDAIKTVLDEHELPDDAEVLGKELTALTSARDAMTKAYEALTTAHTALGMPD